MIGFSLTHDTGFLSDDDKHIVGWTIWKDGKMIDQQDSVLVDSITANEMLAQFDMKIQEHGK